MDVKIYQSYYLEKQKEVLDKSFIPYDNTNGEYPFLYEIPILLDLYKQHKNTDGYWGLVSWKWFSKISKEGKFFVDWIKDNPGYDLYFIDPNIISASMYSNSILQGEAAHPGYLNYMNRLVKKLNIEIDFSNFIFHPDLVSTCTYWVGNKLFWNRWMAFYNRCMSITDNDAKLSEFAYKSIEHAGRVTNHVPFIHERLISIFMLVDDKLKFKHYPYDDSDLYCNVIKKEYDNSTRDYSELFFYKAMYFLSKREQNHSTL